MLGNADAQTMLPVKDLKKAEKFYEDVLGLSRLRGEPGVVAIYRSGSAKVNVYRSDFAGTNKGTAAVWEVEDVDGAVKELKSKGVTFEHYDKLPGLKREGDVHRADGFDVACFKDPSGNILSIQTRAAGSRDH